MLGMAFRKKQPVRLMADSSGVQGGGLDTLCHGLMTGTRVASNLGWRPIEALAVGDKVLTFDHGMQEITKVRRTHLWLDAPDTAQALWPVVIPKGAMGNRHELVLLPDQGVMIECEAASDMYGDPFAIVTANALLGLYGISRRQPMHRVELIAVHFEKDEVVYAEGGALIHCPADMSTLDRFLEAGAPTYTLLSGEAAEELVDLMFIDELLTQQDEEHATGTAG